MTLQTQGSRRDLENQQLFSTIAPRYERAVELLSFGQDARWKADLIAELDLAEGSFVLDIGCGTGTLGRAASEQLGNVRVVGADVVLPMLTLAQARGAALSHYYVTQQDMEQLGIKNASVQAVIAAYVLRNAPNLQETLREIARVLEPGGQFVFLDFVRSPNPVFRAIQDVIIGAWATICGVFVFDDARSGLAIPRSLQQYPDRAALADIVVSSGLTAPTFRLRAFGSVGIGLCRKAY